MTFYKCLGLVFFLGNHISSQAQEDAVMPLDKEVFLNESAAPIIMRLIDAGIVSIQGKNYHLSPFYMAIHETGYDEYILFQDIEFDADDYADAEVGIDAISRPSPPYEDFTKGMGKWGYPAVSITQQAALRYCQWLYYKTGIFFRLPTEAEWQYACELATTSVKDRSSITWYEDNSFERFKKVGAKSADHLGFFDLLGNVSEWTLDQFVEVYAPENLYDPWIQPTAKHSRTIKGGSYLSSIEECNCSSRQKSDPAWQRRDPQIPKSKWWNPDAPFVGFRVIMPVLQPSREEIIEFFNQAIVD